MRLAHFLRSRLVVTAVGCLVLLGAGIITIPRTILKLEQARSLGDGQLASLLNAPSETTAARAALAIGRSRQPAGAPLLVSHVKDPRTSVRALSIYGLGVIGLGNGVSSITKALSDPSGAVRIAALDALGRYEAAKKLSPSEEPRVESAVARSLGDRDPIVAGRAAITLNFFADGPAAGAAAASLVKALAPDEPAEVRERAMWSIFRRYPTRVPRAVLTAGLSDQDEIVRIEAVRAYGKLKDPSAAAALESLRDDHSWRVAEQAAESIKVLEGGQLSTSWTSIPPFVHVPSPQPDQLAGEKPIPMVEGSVAPGAPDAMTADLGPALLPKTAADMTSPAHGPHPRLRLITTKGNLYVVLYPEWAPLTVENFMNLAARGFYDDNRWFRIVPDFVVQTGEKDDKNAPGPGYTIGAEQNPLEQNSYVLSMGLNYDDKTNTPMLDSAGSEYYITLSPQYHLDNDFTVFGRVVGGFDVLGRLVESDRVIRIERISDIVL
ncbi:MAG TPA: peptidylprolyl isomerase [Candidatus Aquilonibacter sp.]|nr:peptidylprolyl isomerase [Candidatus Aquilonibacter sp.]